MPIAVGMAFVGEGLANWLALGQPMATLHDRGACLPRAAWVRGAVHAVVGGEGGEGLMFAQTIEQRAQMGVY